MPGLQSDIDMGLDSLTGTPLERTATAADGHKLPARSR